MTTATTRKKLDASTLVLSPELSLPIEAGTDTTAILGNRGSGKTNTAGVFVEELLKRGQQVVVIDPTDVWWGLKFNKAGDGPGFSVVIAGGRKADVPLDESDGGAFADFIIESGASVVLSTRHLSKAAERRFVAALCHALYLRRAGEVDPSPLTIVFDEAGRDIPQFVTGDAIDCVSAIQQLVRQGRSSGFGIVVIDQRPASVNKEVLELLETMIVHRMTGPLNRKALMAWVENQGNDDTKAKKFLGDMPSLPRGEVWVWSPGLLDVFLRTTIRMRETFDSSKTPKAGERRAAPSNPAFVALDALKSKLAETIERKKRDDPELLRARIRELEVTAAVAGLDLDSPEVDSAALKALEDESYASGHADGMMSERLAWRARMELASKDIGEVHERATTINAALASLVSLSVGTCEWMDRCLVAADSTEVSFVSFAADRRVTPPQLIDKQAPRSRDEMFRLLRHGENDARVLTEKRTKAPSVAPKKTKTTAGDGIADGALSALAFFRQLGITSPTRQQVAAYLRYHPRTPTFVDALKRLEREGLVTLTDGTVTDTDPRPRAPLPSDRVRSLADLHRFWLTKLDGIPQRVVQHLITLRSRSIERTTLARQLNYHPRTPTFVNALKHLAAIDIVRLGGGNVAPSQSLYPERLT